MQLDRLITSLTGPTARPDQARKPAVEGGVPAVPGLYTWWMTPGSLAALEGPDHPNEPVQLLYLGIAPARATSKATLRSRIVGQHLRGNIGASTFRLSLTALLWQEQHWHPCWRTDRALLPAEENEMLSEWQQAHLRVCWCEHPEPRIPEHPLLPKLKPPLNLDANSAHPNAAGLAAARTALRSAAMQQEC